MTPPPKTPPAQTPPPWERPHQIADDEGLDGYIDPDTGLFVLTRGYLSRRGTCCNSGCRHCPYD